MERSQNLWVLMGLLVGFYGNWYFNLLTKFEEVFDLGVFLAASLSATTLFFYCLEITKTWNRGILWNFPYSFYLSSLHLLSTYSLLVYLEGSFLPPNPIRMIGLILWVIIILNEIGERKRFT